MSSAGRTRLVYIKEEIFKTLPANPTMKGIPYNTGDAFTNSRDTLTSGRVQSTRSPRRTRMGTNQPEKSLNAEFVFKEFDSLLAAGFGEQWSGGRTITTNVTVSGAVITLDSGKWSDYFGDGVQVGTFLLFNDDGTLKVLKVSAMADAILTLVEADGETSPILTTVETAESKELIFGWFGQRVSCSVSNTLTFSATGKTITADGTLTSIWENLHPGDNLYLSGTGPNDGWHTVASISGAVLTVEGSLTNDTVDTDVDVDMMTDTGRVGNGNDLPSFSFEEQFLDHNNGAGNFRQINGVKVSQIALSYQPSAFVNLTLTLMGTVISAFSAASAAALVEEAPDREGFDTFTGEFRMHGVVASVSSFDLTLNNQNNRNFNLFERNANAMTDGIPEITGTVNVYFDDAEQSNAFYNETEFSLMLRMVDPEGHAYVIEIVKAKYTGDTISLGDIDVTEALPFTVQPNDEGNEIALYRQTVARE